ncbi:SDR family oxidoreductase [Rhodococcus sp. WS4]|nr:SDR family oxidoreductase [Rhodococcus sp. WS4]
MLSDCNPARGRRRPAPRHSRRRTSSGRGRLPRKHARVQRLRRLRSRRRPRVRGAVLPFRYYRSRCGGGAGHLRCGIHRPAARRNHPGTLRRPGRSQEGLAVHPRPDGCVDTCTWLASDRSAYVTGQEIAVDGGFTQTLMSHVPRPGY